MKLFHLSDLHIGKIVNGYEMWEDQRYVFDQILAYVREEQPDAVMIAGDILSNRIIPISPAAILPQLKLMYPKKKEISIIRSVPI